MCIIRSLTSTLRTRLMWENDLRVIHETSRRGKGFEISRSAFKACERASEVSCYLPRLYDRSSLIHRPCVDVEGSGAFACSTRRWSRRSARFIFSHGLALDMETTMRGYVAGLVAAVPTDSSPRRSRYHESCTRHCGGRRRSL